MSDTAPERVDAAVSYSRQDEALVEPILEGLRAEGLSVWFDKDIPGGALWEEIIARKYRASGALIFFVSKASLASQRCSEEVSTARTLGKPIIPVLLERLKLPDDLPDRFVLTLQARNVVEAFDKPDEEKRRGILRALAAFGIAGAATGVADAGTISAAQTKQPQSAGTESGSTAPVARVDPLAKSNAGVVKASSTVSMKTVAFGGAAAATVLVVGAIIFLQDKKTDVATPANAVSSGSSTGSAAPAERNVASAEPTEPRPTPQEIGETGARAILAQPSYPVGKPIPVRVEGMPGNDNDYVAIALKGAAENADIRYEYLKGRKSADIVLKPLMKAGEYEVRLFFGDDLGTGKSDKVRFRAPLIIGPAAPITLTPESTTVTEGQPLRIRYDGLPGNDRDWIATARADASDADYIKYLYTKGAVSGIADLPPFMKAGQYEIRVYFDDSTSDRTVQARIPIEVRPAPTVNLGLDAKVYAPGAIITVTFNTMPGNKQDWLALSRQGDDGYLTYEYTDGKTSGSETIRAPEEPGSYEIRAYFDDSTGDKTIRAMLPFEVRGAEAPPAPEISPEPQADPVEEPASDPVAEPERDPVLDEQADPAPEPEPTPLPTP
jgi:hypothetical protein